jgi:hypothetical protein
MTTTSGVVVWKRPLELEGGTQPVVVQVVYQPPDPDAAWVNESWRIALLGDVSGLTVGDAARLAVALRVAGEMVAATHLRPGGFWSYWMRGQRPPGLG